MDVADATAAVLVTRTADTLRLLTRVETDPGPVLAATGGADTAADLTDVEEVEDMPLLRDLEAEEEAEVAMDTD